MDRISDLFTRKTKWRSLPPNGYDGVGSGKPALKELAECPHDALSWQYSFRKAGDGSKDPDMYVIRKLRTLIWLQTERVIHCLDNGEPLPEPYAHLAHLALDGDARSEPIKCQLQCSGALSRVEVRQEDVLQVAQALSEAKHKVAVLNMANAYCPGGGFRSGAGAQEENLHRRTDAVRFTDRQRWLYPIPVDGCLLSHNVTVMRGTEADGYPFLEAPFQVSLISVAALENPKLQGSGDGVRYLADSDLETMRLKIRLMVAVAQEARCDGLVLSAFGCGAFGNPPSIVARLFHEALVCGVGIRRVVFCILDDHNARRRHNPRGNFEPFWQTFKDFPGEAAHEADAPADSPA